jgi:hypothetical protein
MTAQELTPYALDTIGVKQATYIVQATQDTATYTPERGRDFVVILSSSGTVTVTATCVAPCDMPLSCPSPGDEGLHAFVMTAAVADGETTYVIPYIEHYINATSGLVTLTFSDKTNTKIGIFRLPV